MVAVHSQTKAYTGSVGRPITSHAATNASPHSDIATTRRRRRSAGGVGSVSGGAAPSGSAALSGGPEPGRVEVIAVKVNRERPAGPSTVDVGRPGVGDQPRHE
jgi:hypothetical protein